jgi:hypothetical protein
MLPGSIKNWLFFGVCYTRSMIYRLNLNKFLENHAISAYRVVKETTGLLAANTVYDLAKKPAQRIDLQTVGQVLGALERITGKTVTINDLLEISPESPSNSNPASLQPPNFTALVANAARTAKSSKTTGKPKGSSQPVQIRGVGLSVVEIIREGRR